MAHVLRTSSRPPSRGGPLLAVAGVALVIVAGSATAAAPGHAGPAAVRRITGHGVGGVTLGRTYAALRARRLIGPIRHGCELGGPNTRAARLRPPLRGSVDFTLTNPRKVTDISVTGGAAARGVGVGATLSDVLRAFPKATVDHSTEHTFGTTAVRVPRGGGGRLEFAVDVKTGKVVVIGVPVIAVCE